MAKTAAYNVWGLDPGTTNFAYACVLFGAQPSQFKTLASGKVEHTVRDTMTNLPEQYQAFLDEITQLFALYPPAAVTIERFMNRGKFSGDTGEYVSMMMGLIIHHLMVEYPECHIVVAQPGVWKQAFNRSQGWESAGQTKGKGRRKKGDKKPATPLDKLYGYALCEPHELDAWLMAHFGASKWWEEKPFTHFVGRDLTKNVQRLEQLATGKKKRARKIIT